MAETETEPAASQRGHTTREYPEALASEPPTAKLIVKTLEYHGA